MSYRLQLWLMQLPCWRWLARALERPSADELEQYRDVKARSEFGVFRPYRPELDDATNAYEPPHQP